MCLKTFVHKFKKIIKQRIQKISKFNNRRDQHRAVHRIEVIENRLYSAIFLILLF